MEVLKIYVCDTVRVSDTTRVPAPEILYGYIQIPEWRDLPSPEWISWAPVMARAPSFTSCFTSYGGAGYC